MAQIEIKNLTFKYAMADSPCLKNVSLNIENGEFVVVCGKSGCGKTTLLRCLKSVLTPNGDKAGEVLFENKKIEEVDERTQAMKIGFVMQNPQQQIVTDKVWHELAFGLECLGYDTPTIRLRVAEMASYFGIHQWFYKNVSELSGGQKQLLNLAAIMAMHPKLLILDEPTRGIDIGTKTEIQKLVLDLADQGMAVAFISSEVEEMLRTCSRMAVLRDGEKVGELEESELSQSNIMKAIAGGDDKNE